MPRAKLKPGMHVGPYELLRRVSKKKWRVRHVENGRLLRVPEGVLAAHLLGKIAPGCTHFIPTTILVDNGPDMTSRAMFDVLRELGIRLNREE